MLRSVALLLVGAAGGGAASSSNAASSQLWPLPARVKEGGEPIRLDAQSFQFVVEGMAASNQVLQDATARYLARITGGSSDAPSTSSIGNLIITVADPEALLAFAVDESYDLSISSTAAELKSATVWGALRGLETFSQLAAIDADGALFVQPAEVSDAPRFPHRGLLVDTARWFFTVDELKKILDSMAWSKLNVLHWHITDAQSFPLQSERFPLLSEKGAFPEGKGGCTVSPACVYTKGDIRELVRYAEFRGVRIMPEIDTPGHSKSWGQGYPNVTVVDSCPGLLKNADDIPLNPIEPFAFELVNGVFEEFFGSDGPFTDSFVHLGGDEVVTSCWTKSPEIQAYLDSHGMSALELEEDFVRKAQGVAGGLGKTPVNWGDVLVVDGAAAPSAKLLPSTVVTAWREPYELHVAASAGFSTILSAGWYVDGDSNKQWRDWYATEPLSPASNWTDPAVAKRVIGGEVSMWGCSGLCPFPTTPGAKWEKKVWPAAAVVAERLWSPASVSDADTAAPRLARHRERLVALGLNAGSIPVVELSV